MAINILPGIYYFLRTKLFAGRAGVTATYSSGFWPGLVRDESIKLFTELNLPQNSVITEIGCGEGLFLTHIAQMYPHSNFIGIDFWENIINEAQLRSHQLNLTNIKFQLSDGKTAPLPDNHADCVFCINTILNVPHNAISGLITELYRICRSGGYIIFDIRNTKPVWLTWQYKLVKFYDPGISVPLHTNSFPEILKNFPTGRVEIIMQKYIGFPRNDFAPIILTAVRKK